MRSILQKLFLSVVMYEFTASQRRRRYTPVQVSGFLYTNMILSFKAFSHYYCDKLVNSFV